MDFSTAGGYTMMWLSKIPTRLQLLALVLVLTLSPSSRSQTPEDQPQGPALAPQESLAKFHVDDRLEWTQLVTEPVVRQPLMATFDSKGRLWVVQYLQYPEPAGIKATSRDNFWRIVYDQLPKPPGLGGIPGADKITIHEDHDGDGVWELVSTFVEGLNIATSVVPTEQGAWVLNPPYLLFYKDADGDSKADGDPEIHLQGFGLEDTHSVVNSLCMGPDGWLYAAQGSTVSAAVKNYGSTGIPLRSMGQAIWRYHPVTHQYEIFAEGGGNAFGVAFDDQGQLFSGHNGGDTRGFHYLQGGYYRKGFSKHGSLSNPYSFGYLDPMKHDPIQRFNHTMLMTNGTNLGGIMPDSFLGVDPLHGKLIHTQLVPVGSTFSSRDIGDTVTSDDKWFRPVAIQDGPDGAAYVSDWYDFQVAHLYAHVGKMDREHGRVYRLSAKDVDESKAPVWNAILARGRDHESLSYLVSCLTHPYRWQRWQASRLIAEHPLQETVRDELAAMIRLPGQVGLESLWTAHQCGWIEDTVPFRGSPVIATAELFSHPNPDVRCWAVRLVADDERVSAEVHGALQRLALIEQDPLVLCQIACSAKRLPATDSLGIVHSLLSRKLPETDLLLPLLIWWAVEQHADQTAEEMQTLLIDDVVWENTITRKMVAANLIQRWSRIGTSVAMDSVAKVLVRIARLPSSTRDDAGKQANEGFELAFEGRSLTGVPDAVVNGLEAVGQTSLSLRLRRGDSDARAKATEVIQDSNQSLSLRIQLTRILGEVHSDDAVPVLLSTAIDGQANTELRAAAISSLAVYNRPDVAGRLIETWPEFPSELRSVASAVISSRHSWTAAWASACEQNQVDPQEISMEIVRNMRMHNDPDLQKRLDMFYPVIGGIDLQAAQKRVLDLAALVLESNGDPYAGKKLFKNSCGRCHKLFEQGGNIGPDLTGYQRDQLNALLLNIVAPSLEVREGFQSVAIVNENGQVVTGYVEHQNDSQVILRGIDGQTHTLDRQNIESLVAQPQSIMPEGLLDNLKPAELRDLVAYLRSSQPLNDGT